MTSSKQVVAGGALNSSSSSPNGSTSPPKCLPRQLPANPPPDFYASLNSYLAASKNKRPADAIVNPSQFQEPGLPRNPPPSPASRPCGENWGKLPSPRAR